MTSGADLFVVCKQCGSEVSPYITECPYCGSRLRRRAPKLPRADAPEPPAARARCGPARRRAPAPAPRARRRARASRPAAATAGRSRGPTRRSRSWLASCAAWVACPRRRRRCTRQMVDRRARCTATGGGCSRSQFAYDHGLYAFVAIVAIAIFGWLLERRHGPVVVLALFFGAGVTGALVALAVYAVAVVSGGNAGALALLAAWAVPDLRRARSRLLLRGRSARRRRRSPRCCWRSRSPTRSRETSWLAGVVGAASACWSGSACRAPMSAIAAR